MKHDDPSRGRPTPGPDMEQTLRAEVRHAQERLDLATDQLRRWLLSHPEHAPVSVYESRGLTQHETDGSSWRRG
jgi:hypothetical protein